ncbi:DUF3379 family protein [Aliagarivorans marinus]|uniref:DUF3379 family protein n=1 Tax=Aliagarivorans marinus TaxID=561965 RepID=UPI00041B529D|nr:DUF3379 family protein [Aliagarivorans marinus]
MDELEFRRQLYANPRDRSDALLAAIKDSPKNQKFYDELQQFEGKLQRAMEVDVPDGLSERLRLRQSFAAPPAKPKRPRWHMALAASVAFAMGIGVSTLNPFTAGQPSMSLGDVALDHVYHASPYITGTDERPSLQTVNAKLARYGEAFEQLPGQVVFVNHCNYHGSPAFHMVMRSEQGSDVNVFVVPQTVDLPSSSAFSDSKMHGMVSQLSDANLVIVGEKAEPLDGLLHKIKGQLNQSI